MSSATPAATPAPAAVPSSAAAPRVVAVIPARYASTRFPGKPLALIAGKPMIQWVYERASRARVADVVVATDDARIADCVRGFGGRVAMTRADHPTGTDRIAEAVRGLQADWVLNVQGDEPLVPPSVLDELVSACVARPDVQLGTVAVPLDPALPTFLDANVVKVVVDAGQHALYFSRAPIPHARGPRGPGAMPLRHWGIYLFRTAFLQQFVTWPQSPLERCESLEQLRALEHGARIYVLISHHLQSIGVDVPGDIAQAEALIRAGAAAL